jgi:Ca2+-binding EF-hand superfamily protein
MFSGNEVDAMRYLTLTMILAAGLWAAPAMAEESKDGEKGDRQRDEIREQMLKEHDKDGDGKLSDDERKAAKQAMHERMVKEFDKDGDGKLSEDERQKMRESMHEKFGKGKKDGDRGAGKKGKKEPGDRRGPGFRPDRPRGPRGPGGPPLPSPEEMFEKFDEDKNDSLSRDEFKKMTAFVHEHRPMGPPPRGPEGRRDFRGHGPDGRGPEFRRPDGPRDGDGQRDFRREGGPRGDRPGPGNFDRRRGDREGRPDRPRDGERDDDGPGDEAEKAEDESV